MCFVGRLQEQSGKASHKDVRNAKSYVGHSDYQAMKPYIEIAEKTKADAMKLFEQEMEK